MKWQERVKSFLPLHQQTGVSLRFPTSRVPSTSAPWWPRGAARNLRQLPEKKKNQHSCTSQTKIRKPPPRTSTIIQLELHRFA